MKLLLDAKSTIQMVTKAGSSKVRYTRRTTGISLYWMYELYRGLFAELEHKSGDYLCPDTFTKPLNDEKFSRFRDMLGVIDPARDHAGFDEYFTHALCVGLTTADASSTAQATAGS